MPTRYLKPGVRDSGHIEALAEFPDAEILYYRLLVTVDDYGRFDGRPDMVKGYCFPVRLRATADKCMQWLQTLHDAGLIVLYEIDNKRYLQIKKWDNRPRAASSKYPDPPPSVYRFPQMLPKPEPELKPKHKPELDLRSLDHGGGNGQRQVKGIESLTFKTLNPETPDTAAIERNRKIAEALATGNTELAATLRAEGAATPPH